MITQAETGLSNDDYAALLAAQENPDYKVTIIPSGTAFRGSLAVLNSTDGALLTRPVAGWDLIECFGGVTHVQVSDRLYVSRWTSATPTAPAHTDYAIGSATAMPIASLVTNGTTLRVFYVDGYCRICYQDSTDGQTFGGETVMGTQPSLSSDEYVNFLAATALDTVHIAIYNPATFNYYFRTMNYYGGGPTWVELEQYLVWQHRMHHMDAQRLNGVDTILVSTFLPQRASVSTSGNSVTKIGYDKGGLIAFQYSPETLLWTDHVVVDTLDMVSQFLCRTYGRLWVESGQLVAVCEAVDGADYNSYDAVNWINSYRLYTSTDGRYWSSGRILNGVYPANNWNQFLGGGFKYGVIGTTAFGCDYNLARYGTYGGAPVDITSRIDDYSFSVGDSFGTQITLDNSDGAFDPQPLNVGVTPIPIAQGYQVIHQWGYYLPGHTTPTLIQVARCYIETVSYVDENPDRTVMISDRDRISWLSDRHKAEQALQLGDPGVGYDTWRDDGLTGYGGMTHSADETSGVFRTDGNNEMILSANDAKGIAFSTFIDELWNGESSVFFTFPDLTQVPVNFAGVVFRATDKDNYWAVTLQSNGYIFIEEWRGGVLNTNNTVGSIELGNHYERYLPSNTVGELTTEGGTISIVTGTTYGLRVRIRYGRLDIWFCPDAYVSDYFVPNWYYVGTFEMFGTQLITETSDYVKRAPMDIGFTGQIGQSYSDTTDWPAADTTLQALHEVVDQVLNPTPAGVPFPAYGLNYNSAHLDVNPGPLPPPPANYCDPSSFPAGWTVESGTLQTTVYGGGPSAQELYQEYCAGCGGGGANAWLSSIRIDIPPGVTLHDWGYYVYIHRPTVSSPLILDQQSKFFIYNSVGLVTQGGAQIADGTDSWLHLDRGSFSELTGITYIEIVGITHGFGGDDGSTNPVEFHIAGAYACWS